MTETLVEIMNPQLEQFRSLPDADVVKGLVAWFVRAHQLPQRAQHCVNWGLTLPASMNGEQLKVNIGAQQAFYAEYFDDGWWCFVYVPRNEASERILQAVSKRVAVGPGQMNAPMREQLVAVGRPSTIAELLRDPGFFEQSAALVDAFARRKLPKSDRANVKVAEYVLDTPAELLASPPMVEIGQPYQFSSEVRLERSEPAWRLKHLLGRELQRRGLVALVPTEGDADWDLAWHSPAGVTLAGIAGIAGLDPGDEERELRTALGAMMRRAHQHREAAQQLVLVVDRAPVDASWFDVFTQLGMSLVPATHIPGWLDDHTLAAAHAA